MEPTGTQIAVFGFLVVIITFLKIVYNHRELAERKLFALYFFLLLAGGIISGSAQIFAATKNQLNSDTQENTEIANSLEVFGVIFIDGFFGLMPNLFYSVYRTKLTKTSGEITHKYFLTNGIIISILFIVLLITEFVYTRPIISSNTILFVVMIYSFSFYVLVIIVLRNLKGRVQKIMWRYFIYVVYATTVIFIRNFFTIFSYVNAYDPEYINITWGSYTVDSICAGVTLAVVALFLREIKFSPHAPTPKESSVQKDQNLLKNLK